ncbi:hypothetical protein G7054_g43 [Neopestalotiopsis clavispora]|nr:hypothetical protein G7054_g43 [Neopestalotiopsis clavispora]
MLASTRLLLLTSTSSFLVAGQGPLIPIVDCDDSSVVSAAAILSTYSPALAYCSKVVPLPISFVTSTETSIAATVFTHVAVSDAFTTETTTSISTNLQFRRRSFPTDIPFEHGGKHGKGGHGTHRGSSTSHDKLPGYGSHQGYQVNPPNGPGVTHLPIPDSEPAAELEYLQASNTQLLTSVCSCIEDPVRSTVTATALTTATFTLEAPIEHNTATITELVTVTRDATVTSTITSTALCTANAIDNLVSNGGFDEFDAADLGKITPWRLGNDPGFGTSFFASGGRFQAPSQPNFAGFPVDLPGLYMHLFQDLTNIPTGAIYTVTFWYWPFSLRPRRFSVEEVVDGACHLDVSWGDTQIASLAFDNVNGTQGTWSQYTFNNIVQLDATATLTFYYHCDREWFGDGSGASYIDSIAIFPSDEVLCL